MGEYILPALKLIGLLLTAFFWLAALFRQKGESLDHERRNRRWTIAAIFASFAVAASAELIDTIYKKQDVITFHSDTSGVEEHLIVHWNFEQNDGKAAIASLRGRRGSGAALVKRWEPMLLGIKVNKADGWFSTVRSTNPRSGRS